MLFLREDNDKTEFNGLNINLTYYANSSFNSFAQRVAYPLSKTVAQVN